MAWVGWNWEACAANIDESKNPDEDAQEYVIRIAQEKVNFPVPLIKAEDIIIAADTIVVLDGQILGKPVNDKQAEEMLIRLRDRSHIVMTAIAVRDGNRTSFHQEICTTDVHMRAYTQQEIIRYINSGDPLDKAGAYAIQNDSFQPAINFCGCFASVMGMPLCHLERSFRKLPNYEPRELAGICQNHLKYNCPITSRVMAGEEIG